MYAINTAPYGSIHHTLLLAIISLAVFAALLVFRIVPSKKHGPALPLRPGHTEDSFVHHLASRGFNPRIARITYRHLQKRRGVKFAILMNDRLIQDLGLNDRAVVETTRALLTENNRLLTVRYDVSKIATVGELVAFVQSCPCSELEIAS